jgi:signal transduction histidine kinase
MLQTAGWLARVTAVVVIGLGTFLHSPVSTPVLAAQAVAFGVGVAALGIWALIDFGVPPMAGRTRVAAAVLVLLAATSGVCVSRNGAGLIAFGAIAALAAGGESSLITGWVITGIGALAIEIGVLVWSPGIGTAIGYPLLLVVALLVGQTRRSYRLQAEQSAALLAQMEQLRAEQRQVAVLNERTRIAREIHDVLAHSLGALGIQIQAARAVLSDQRDVGRALGILEQAQRIAGDGLGETRRAIHALRSDARPLPVELEQLAESHHARHHVPVTVHVDGDVRALPPDAALALLRTAQESLVNAAKHARSQPARIDLSFDASQTTLTVTSPLPGGRPPAGTGSAEADAGKANNAGRANADGTRADGAQIDRTPVDGAHANETQADGTQVDGAENLMKTANAGYGLMGLRERLLLLGGTLTAGPRGGQWIVTAQVPR